MSLYMFRLNSDALQTPKPCLDCFSYFAYVYYDVKNASKQEKNTRTPPTDLNNETQRRIDTNTYVRENIISLVTVNKCYNR